MFQFDQLAVAEQRISELNRSSPPPGLEDKVTEVNQRWKQVVKQTKDRYIGWPTKKTNGRVVLKSIIIMIITYTADCYI